jgi:ADP-heptose:LPS heptosyltransferase
LVLLTPVLRELKRLNPECKIGVATMSVYRPVLLAIPYIDEMVDFPVPVEAVDRYDSVVYYENAIEHNPRAQELHMTEVFGEIAGINMTFADKKPDYRVKPSEMIWANEAYPRRAGKRRACMQVGASSMIRVYHRQRMGDVLGKLLKAGFEVFLLGQKGEIQAEERQDLRNLAQAGLTVRQTAAVVNASDVFIGNDSAFIHIAGALGVPGVGLYGPFPWKLRTAYSPSIYAFQGDGKCAPCFHHVSGALNNQFPENCPSASKGFCHVLADIKPERVARKAMEIARNLAGGDPMPEQSKLEGELNDEPANP